MTDLSLNSVRGQIGNAAPPNPGAFQDPLNQARAEATELQAREQFLELRGTWSGWLIGWISCLLVYQIILAVAVGRGWLGFKDYQWFLPSVVLENFGQIVGMGYIIVRFLYPDGGKEKAKR